MSTHPNVQQVQQFLDIYASGDRAALGDLLADDIVWHVAGSHRFSGDYRGREAVLAYFDDVAAETSGSLKLDPLEVIASDEHGAVFLRATGDREGHHLDVVMAEALTFDSDGRLTEFFAMANDQDAIDAFWAGGGHR